MCEIQPLPVGLWVTLGLGGLSLGTASSQDGRGTDIGHLQWLPGKMTRHVGQEFRVSEEYREFHKGGQETQAVSIKVKDQGPRSGTAA